MVSRRLCCNDVPLRTDVVEIVVAAHLLETGYLVCFQWPSVSRKELSRSHPVRSICPSFGSKPLSRLRIGLIVTDHPEPSLQIEHVSATVNVFVLWLWRLVHCPDNMLDKPSPSKGRIDVGYHVMNHDFRGHHETAPLASGPDPGDRGSIYYDRGSRLVSPEDSSGTTPRSPCRIRF